MTPDPGTRRGDGERASTDVAELQRRIVEVGRLRHPRTQLAIVVVLGVLGTVCLLATLTRMSALPLLPLGPLAVAVYAAWRVRGSPSDRAILGWVTVLASSVALCVWLVALVGRILQ